MILVADIGNSTAHMGIWHGEELLREVRAGVENLSHGRGPEGLIVDRNGGGVEAVVVASVNPRVGPGFAQWAQGATGMAPLEVGVEIALPIPVQVDRPGEVGVDRVVNAAAAYRRCQGAAIVVDFGSAVTLDVVSAEGAYVGGVIAPGARLSVRALSERTALIPPLEIQPTDARIGKSTEEAVRIGITYGFAGLVDRLVRHVREALGGQPRIFGTGGDAEWIAPRSEEIEEVIPHLTLEGIRIAYERHLGGGGHV